MSGGRWGYKQYRLEEMADEMQTILKYIAQAEHIVDWSESHDTCRKDMTNSTTGEPIPGAESELYDLMVKLFDELYD